MSQTRVRDAGLTRACAFALGKQPETDLGRKGQGWPDLLLQAFTNEQLNKVTSEIWIDTGEGRTQSATRGGLGDRSCLAPRTIGTL